MMVKVLFVCLGNICRSPTAHGVFAAKVNEVGLADRIGIDSAGTGDWHIGESPDRRAIQAAADRGYDLSSLKARQINAADFVEFDYIVAMDGENMNHLIALCPEQHRTKLSLLLSYGKHPISHVPDPYYGGRKDFDEVVDLVESSTMALLDHIQRSHF